MNWESVTDWCVIDAGAEDESLKLVLVVVCLVRKGMLMMHVPGELLRRNHSAIFECVWIYI